MAEPFISEIRMMSFNFAPRGWALCNGQLLPLNQNQALFALLGTAYGGNGTTNMALPDLRGRTPIHTGGVGHFLGEHGGEQSHTLTIAEIPSHGHTLQGTTQSGDTAVAAGNLLGGVSNVYTPPANLTTLLPASISTVGGQAHENMQPYLTINFCIALQGVFPSPH